MTVPLDVGAAGVDASRPPRSESCLAELRLRAARARIADSGALTSVRAVLGTVTLRDDQRATAGRVRAQIARDGGCLLADEVGTGKTYVALAVARDWAAPLVLIPAALRDSWGDAMRRAGIPCAVATHEALSRGWMPTAPFDGIIVDESHHFRASSRRYASLARLAARVPVLLLSATPLQNRESELAAQVALFAGSGAHQLDRRGLSRYVVRGTPAPTAALPRAAPPRWLRVPSDDGEVLRSILALPAPPRAADVGDGGALLVVSLARAWASSRAALVASIRRRRRILAAMEQCHAEGRIPTRMELRSWQGETDVQLGFASLLAEARIHAADAGTLAASIAHERCALDAVSAVVARHPDPDIARASALRTLRSEHPGASLLAFGERASTVGAYHALLRREAGVGMLTARASTIASGRVSRRELLARFAPHAQGAVEPAPHDRVTLLLATDLLSEGVNLQDASVVVHLDLPWNPARMTQRLGRVRRPGGAREVFSYLVAPPADASSILRMEERLRAKLDAAARTIGVGLDVLPPFSAAAGATTRADPRATVTRVDTSFGAGQRPRSAAEAASGVVERLRRWRTPAGRGCARGRGCVVAAVWSTEQGWLARLDDGRLLAWLGPPRAERGDVPLPVDDPLILVRAVAHAEGQVRRVTTDERRHALEQLHAYLAREWLHRTCGTSAGGTLRHREAERVVDRVAGRAPRHQRSAAFSLAGQVRAVLASPLSLGVELELEAHCAMAREHPARQSTATGNRERAMDPLRWLARAREILQRPAPTTAPNRRPSVRAAEPVAIILLGS